ncbi:MAG: sulfotransferase family protein, partial [Carbonactinosporaceae bacterium]
GDRLLTAPVFILSSVRSGSTLLRVLLDSHSQFHAPHEIHLRGLQVDGTSHYTEKSMRALGLHDRDLQHLLWDRVLHRELQGSGKRYIVDKTPQNALIWRRIAECWPDARFIFLLRHPLSVAMSRQAARRHESLDRNVSRVLRFLNAVEEARNEHPGFAVRYEELAADPRAVTQRLCGFLQVDWEPRMLEYGSDDHGRFEPGLGDWGHAIRSGRVQPPRPLPVADEMPAALHDLCAAWGYPGAGSRAPIA